MNSPYHPPPDMSQQQIPMAPAAAPGYPSSIPPMHGYQHQHQHQHQQPPLPPPPPHSQPHPHQHQHQHQHQQQHQHQPHQQPHQPHPPHQPHQHPSHQHQHQPPPLQHSLSHHQQPPLPPPSQQLPPPTSHHHLQHHPLHQQPPLQSQHQQQPPQQHQHQASRPDEASPTATSPSTGEPIVRVLVPFSKVDESTSRKYSLDVVQQPLRARMCGFGDKDRRPITPPPCVRLIIVDAITGKEIDCNDIDYSMFVLNVDLWNEEGTREVNLVRSSSGTPAVTSSASYSYTLNGSDSNPSPYSQQVLPPSREPAYSPSPAMGYVSNYPVQQTYSQAPPSYPSNGSYGPPTQYFPQHGGYREPAVPPLASQGGMVPFRNGSQSGYGQDQTALTRMALGGQPQGMFTRNLIGSLAASAFRLSDTNDKIGVWFVLQDLSVRTEGPFRLRFSFVNVGPPGGPGRDPNGNKVNQGRAPILASCFSDVFHVYSAKKFPGVCESTGLSKTFATQGIKIPIRKDAKGEEDSFMDGG